MSERPILFSAPMIQAILDGRKTQTRRRITPQPKWVYADRVPVRTEDADPKGEIQCPYGIRGSRLWVRETYYAWGRWETRFDAKKGRDAWHFVDMTAECGHEYRYAADETPLTPRRSTCDPCWWKRPAIFMPRAASRITLEVESVRVERLREISEADAWAEGVAYYADGMTGTPSAGDVDAGRVLFRRLWESINGPGSWDDRWVWVVGFRRIDHTSTAPANSGALTICP